MKCELCDFPTDTALLVRPVGGGPRWEVFLCDEPCREIKRAALGAEGLKEAPHELGWDAFQPIWQDTK